MSSNPSSRSTEGQSPLGVWPTTSRWMPERASVSMRAGEGRRGVVELVGHAPVHHAGGVDPLARGRGLIGDERLPDGRAAPGRGAPRRRPRAAREYQWLRASLQASTPSTRLARGHRPEAVLMHPAMDEEGVADAVDEPAGGEVVAQRAPGAEVLEEAVHHVLLGHGRARAGQLGPAELEGPARAHGVLEDPPQQHRPGALAHLRGRPRQGVARSARAPGAAC